MQAFIRNVIGVALLAGLFFAVGCASTPSGGKPSALANGFPWSNAEKRPEKAEKASMHDFLGHDRVTPLGTR